MHRPSPLRLSALAALLLAALTLAAPPTAARPTAPTAPVASATSGALGTATISAPRDTIVAVSNRTLSAPMTAERAAALSNLLRTAGEDWIGVPYRWGGTTRRGIDCSAFVQQFVRSAFAIDLPRATAGQQYEGVSIDRDQLLPGDLVFFRRRGVRHVGVFLGDGDFIHASSSRGVMVSDLSDDYWDRSYWMSRRILRAPSDRRPTPRSEARRQRGDTTGTARAVRSIW